MQLRRWLLAVGMLAPVGLMGCSEEVSDIDRVQPHYTKKSDLQGEWYYRQTVVDWPAQHIDAFSGIECGLEKVRFEFRETQLLAYRTHEAIPGLDNNDTADGATFVGDPVAIFPIESHFDIIRDFNKQTGEQSNVLVEDTTLRPWYERDFIRVNWVSSGVDGPVDCASILQFGRRTIAEQGYRDYNRVSEASKYDPDQLQISEDHLMFTETATIWDTGWACFLAGYSGSIYGSSCGPVDGKVRHAFSRVDEAEVEQFEPAPHLDSEMQREAAEPFVDANGNGRFDDSESFTDTNANGRWDDNRRIKYATVTVGADRQHMVDVACTPEVLEALDPEIQLSDCRDLQWHHNGRFGYFRTEKTAYDRRVGAGHDANRIHLANHHQMWKWTKDENGASIPLNARELRPIIYYLNPNFPEDLKATTVKLAKDWNQAFMEAALTATGRDRSALENQLASDFDEDTELAVWLDDADGNRYGPGNLFQVRDNNCSVTGVERYLDWYPALQFVVEEATEGEGILPGNIQNVCAGLGYESRKQKLDRPFVWQQMGDVRFSFIWWVNEAQARGPLGYGPSSADQQSGRIISGNAYVYGAAVDSYARGAADIVRWMNGELCDSDDDQFNCLTEGRSFGEWFQRGNSQAAENPEAITPEFQQMISERLGTANMEGYRPFKNANGVDKAAMRRHMKQRVRRPSPSDPLKWAADVPYDEARERLEVLKQDPAFRARMLSEPMLQAVGPLFGWRPGQEVPEGMMDLALDLSVDPGVLRRLREERVEFFTRHNVMLPDFIDDSVIGQALALKGMDPEEVYQVLRRDIFEAVMLHEIGHTVGLRHNFKSSFDALNYPEDFWQIRERYSEGEWDDQRLPEFRYASIMDYGARFNSDTKGLGKYDYAAIKYVYGKHAEVFADEVTVPGRFDLELEFTDYTKIPEMLGGDLDNLYKREDRPVADLQAEKQAGVLENAELLVQNRDRAASDFWSERTVPFHYCSDEFRGDLKCRTWDEGANHTEAVQSAIQRYWNYYLFNSYRRGRSEQGFIQSFFGQQGRVSEYLTYPWKYYRFFDAYPVDVREDLLKAATMGLNFINEVMGTPEPGRYCFYEQLNAYLPSYFFNFDFQADCQGLDVGVGEGRDMYLDFNDEYLYQIDYLGSYYDKINLLFELISTNSGFYRVTDDTDDRQYTIGYYQVFQNEMLDLLRDMMVTSLFYFRADNSFQRLVTNGNLRTQLLVDPRRVGLERNTYEGVPRVFSQVPYNLMWQAVALTSIFNTTSHDRRTDFVEYISISEDGSGDDRVIEGQELVRFTHPHTGQVYVAAQTDDGKSLAVNLMSLAQNYVNTTWRDAQAARDAAAINPEASPQQRAQAEESFQDAEEQLQEFVELMDDLRQLKSWVDVGR